VLPLALAGDDTLIPLSLRREGAWGAMLSITTVPVQNNAIIMQ
jgi:hypothetical protein